MRTKAPSKWKGKVSNDDLLNTAQASDALGGNVSAQALRKRVRQGDLKCHWQQATPGLVFIRRSELIALYAHKIDGWKGVKRARG